MARQISDHWTFRSDLMAVPMVMGWQGESSVAMVMTERMEGRMSALGFDQRSGQVSMVGAWPKRDEPRPRDISLNAHVAAQIARGEPTEVYEMDEIASGGKRRVNFWLFMGDNDPHAYKNIFRETFARWDSEHGITPWFPGSEGMHHAAHGLYQWHYDDEYEALWETCHFSSVAAPNPKQVHRFEMHTGFVSGTPYAHALRQYGLRFHRAEEAEAGRKLLDHMCRNLTPWGTFWSVFYKDGKRWGTGWHSAEEWQATPGQPSEELQARTLADATLYAARAALAEKQNARSKSLWTKAVVSNLDFVGKIQRSDGNLGQGYSRHDGRVIYWDSHEGLFWIAALAEGYRLTGEGKYLEIARKAGRYYEPFIRDAYITGAPEGARYQPTSEDPMNGVVAYTNLWKVTGEKIWLDLAVLCAEFLMTYRWQYNTVFPPLSTCGAYGLKTKGWDISSPNNIHIHPYGLACVPEMIEIWKATGDAYLMRQNANCVLSLLQMMAPYDGSMDARRGMMTERFYQTTEFGAKGQSLPLSHAWCNGLILLTGLALMDQGHLHIDEQSGECFALEAVSVHKLRGGILEISNPWDSPLDLKVTVRKWRGSKRKYPARIRLEAKQTITLKG
ncbi:glycoside hydrolase family 127 protein [Oscillatoria laete-virens NRMC-F 0139]|nr:glycoside hydrolase family 127 protein [Oscillatoria laete-virens NRMC-F 0139]